MRPFLPVGGQQRLCLDGVAEAGAGAVRLDDVHVGGGEARGGQGLADDALLGGAVGGGQTVGGTVLVDGGAAHDGQDPVAVAAGVGQLLHEEEAHSLGPAGAVRGCGEGLAATVGRQSAQPGELDEGDRCRHHGGAAGEGQVALAAAQGAGREVQGDEGGGAGGVDGDGRAFEAVRVGDAARGDGARAAAEQVALEVLRGEVGA
ncbi:hypothetical protein EES45_35090 [Streptomyces sp. ADI97-07]|nr:hypothetical protein EES45_35090 [Streptomyces sp. ADI97-07]